MFKRTWGKCQTYVVSYPKKMSKNKCSASLCYSWPGNWGKNLTSRWSSLKNNIHTGTNVLNVAAWVTSLAFFLLSTAHLRHWIQLAKLRLYLLLLYLIYPFLTTKIPWYEIFQTNVSIYLSRSCSALNMGQLILFFFHI